MRKLKIPLTPGRWEGALCSRCDTHIKDKRGCVRCQKDRNNARKQKARQTPDHPARVVNLARKRIWSNADYVKRPGRYLAKLRARQIPKRQIPSWANVAKISAIYSRAYKLGKVVDHVVPLKSSIVCGLHVETNLRVVARSTNARKSNKLIEALL